MAQVKVYGERQRLAHDREEISNAVHEAMRDVLKLPEEKRFHRFIGLDAEDFIFPQDRGGEYIVIEILMFEGRSESTRRALLRRLMSDVPDAIGCPMEAIEVTLIETSRSSWGIRGKIGDELNLDYDVNH